MSVVFGKTTDSRFFCLVRKLGSVALNFLRVIADGVGQSNRSVRFLLRILVCDFRKIEGNGFHRERTAAVASTGVETRNNEILERNFIVCIRCSVAARFAAAQNCLRNVIAFAAGEEQLNARFAVLDDEVEILHRNLAGSGSGSETRRTGVARVSIPRRGLHVTAEDHRRRS